MQRFKFRLQRVLEWQTKVARMTEEKLRLSRLSVSEAEDSLQLLRAAELEVENQSLSPRLIAAGDLQSLSRHRVKAARDERALLNQKQERLRLVEEVARALSAERMRQRLIEKLRERAMQEYTVALQRELETLALESHLANSTRAQRTTPE